MGGRIQALKSELKHDWDELNLAAKSLVIIGAMQLGIIIYFSVIDVVSLQISKNIEVIFRSSLASIFGFILSSNTKNNNKKNMHKKSLTRKEDNEHKYEYKEVCERIRDYDYGNGNSVQIFIALITTLVSAVVILVIYINNIPTDTAILSQFRDFMCTSIGFLLGESKIRSD